MSSHNWMGQWSNPWTSRMRSSNVIPSIMRESERRKWSNRQATWWVPDLQFV
jgi:hypothetical protein